MKQPWLTRLMWTAYLAHHWRGQSRFPYRSPGAIQRAQTRRVRRMVAHAYRTVPYYRETMDRLGLGPNDIKNASDLARLPILERGTLQRDPEYFASTAASASPHLETSSSGSSGALCTVRWDTAAIFQNAAHSERERSIIAGLTGRFVHYRESVITTEFASDRKIQTIYSERALVPSRVRLEHQYLSLLDSPEKNARLLNDFRPDVIRSYGSYLARLFSHVHSTGMSFHRPKVVFYDADELPPAARRLITETFGIQVLSAYQAIEAFKIGFECERHLGLHLNVDLYPVRIVDGSGAELPPGENGDVVVSNLVNRATVLLNYRLGDIAHVMPEACPCGRTLPLLSFIQGRTDDWIRLSSGEMLHPQSVRTMFNAERTVWQYQVVQEETDHFRVSIVGGSNRAELCVRLRKRFAERFGANVRVDIAYVDTIQPSPGGKVRPVISITTAGR
jgi:phenylacetate-CoA ligase